MSDKNEKSSFLKKLNIPSLVIGIIITFFVTKILEPILESIYSAFLNLGGNFITAISDSTYQKISDGFSEQGTMFITYFLYAIVCYFTIWFLSKIKQSYDEDLKALSDLTKNASECLSRSDVPVIDESSAKVDSAETSEKLFEYVEDLSTKFEENNKLLKGNCQKIIETTPQLRKKYKHSYIKACAAIAALFVVFAFMYIRLNFINERITITTNNIEIVSPYLDYQEYQQLKSDFHSIQNKKDYDALHDKLNSIAEENSLTLKE